MTKWHKKVFSDYLTNIIRVKLIMKRKTLLHCASVCDNNNNATLLTGFGDTGKSSLTYMLVKDGLRYLGDDHVIVSNSRVFSFPTGMGVDYNTINKLGINVTFKKRIEAVIRQLLLFVYSSVTIKPDTSQFS